MFFRGYAQPETTPLEPIPVPCSSRPIARLQRAL